MKGYQNALVVAAVFAFGISLSILLNTLLGVFEERKWKEAKHAATAIIFILHLLRHKLARREFIFPSLWQIGA